MFFFFVSFAFDEYTLQKYFLYGVVIPWFTNRVELLVLQPGTKGGFEDCDRIAILWLISHVLVLQKPSDEPPSFFTTFPWILSPFDGSSTSTTKDLSLLQQPKQFLLCTQTHHLYTEKI